MRDKEFAKQTNLEPANWDKASCLGNREFKSIRKRV